MTLEPLKALVADDDPQLLSLVSRHAKTLGFSVVEAGDGDAAWEAAQAHRPTLVILDVMMPNMSGWDVCKRVKHELPDTAVLMLTGIGEHLNDMTSPLFAADGWMNKPFDFPDLDEKIREVLAAKGVSMPAVDHHHEAAAEPASGPEESAPAKRATRKAPAKKPAAKKPAAKKPAAKKAPAKKPAAKKAPAKKPAAKKPAAKKAPAKKPAAKKPAAKKAPAKKPAAKKTPAKKPAAKKTPAKK